MPLTLVKIEQPEVDETKLELTLLSDLTAPVPNDVAIDFDVFGVTLGEDGYKLAVIIDNDLTFRFTTARAQIKGLTNGYHLLRAMILDAKGACVKSSLGYVEAEFYAVTESAPARRDFMFGQPSLCLVSPRGDVKKSEDNGILVDFFVHNCGVSEGPSGFAVNIYANGKQVGTITEWEPFELRGLTALDRQIKFKAVLVNPAGEEVTRPAYNATTQFVEVKSRY